MDPTWTRARTRARRAARLKVHVTFIGVYLGLGLLLVLALPDIRSALVLWVLLLLPLFAVIYFLAARTGWDAPKDFVCPSCKRFIPFDAEGCPMCGYCTSATRGDSPAPGIAHKVPKGR